MTWSRVAGFNKYSISKNGEVRHDRLGRIKKNYLNKNGYWAVCLMRDGAGKSTVEVHRLLAKAYIPNPQNKPTVNHIDGDRSNLKLENLEWATYQENCNHGFSMGRRPGNDKISKDAVKKIREMYSTGRHTQEFIGRKFGVTQAQVSSIVLNKSWKNLNL